MTMIGWEVGYRDLFHIEFRHSPIQRQMSTRSPGSWEAICRHPGDSITNRGGVRSVVDSAGDGGTAAPAMVGYPSYGSRHQKDSRVTSDRVCHEVEQP